MLARQHRLAMHATSAVLLAGVAVVATGGGAGAAGPSKPGVYGGDATAASIEFRVDKSPLPIPAVTDPFHLWVPYAETTIGSSGVADGIASTVYPGQDAIGGPNLLCSFSPEFCAALPGGAPPDYPDWAHAQYPAHPDDDADISQKPFPGGGAPFAVTPNHAAAHADRDLVKATSITAGAGLAGVVTVDSATSNSRQSFKDGALVLTAESTLKGIDIGGQLHIDQIHSIATGTIDGSKVGVATAKTTVSGATVAGQSVTIDSTGVHAGGSGDDGLLKQTVNSALETLNAAGISVISLGTTKAAKPRKVAAETGGLLLVFTHTVEGGPALPAAGAIENGKYLLTAALGGAGINAFAGPDVSFDGVSIPPPTTGGTQVQSPSATGGGVPASTPLTGGSPTTQTGDTPSDQQPAVAADAPAQAALPTDITNKRLETLALVLLGYPLLVLIAAPFRAPSRLPRGG